MEVITEIRKRWHRLLLEGYILVLPALIAALYLMTLGWLEILGGLFIYLLFFFYYLRKMNRFRNYSVNNGVDIGWGRAKIILWVRKFHKGKETNELHKFLESAVSPWGYLVTLADSDVTIDPQGRLFRSKIFILFISFAFAIFLWSVYENSPWLFLPWLALIIYTLWDDMFAPAAKRAVYNINEKNLADMPKFLDEVRGNKRKIIACPQNGGAWRWVVMELSSYVDMVLITEDDLYGRSTDNISWEVELFKQRLGVGKIAKIVSVINESERRASDSYPVLVSPKKLGYQPFSKATQAASILIGNVIFGSVKRR